MQQETANTVIDERVALASQAYQFLKNTTVQERAKLMYTIADKIEALGQHLLDTAHEETSLPIARLTGEKARTVLQWRTYGKAVEQGLYAEARIDTANAEKTKNDIRKYNIGLGPIVVFGASNFPFAYSTAGGDTASSIGAGCPVLLKAHPAHLKTSTIMASAITDAIASLNWPEGIFSHVVGTSLQIGEYLVKHPQVKGVGFTGSFSGGKALFDMASRRKEPIPVFAEMGSVNPVFALEEFLQQKAETLAKEYAASLTLGAGQFCTNPGIFIALKGDAFERFKSALQAEIPNVTSAKMLHQGILDSYEKNKETVILQPNVTVVAKAETSVAESEANACVVQTDAETFINNSTLSEEVFGPFGILVACNSYQQMLQVAKQLSGQLTVTVSATPDDIRNNAELVAVLKDKCGRLLFGGMPTGVEVIYAMQHGGPFPSTTDARFTSVGPDAVKRFLRPIAFQNWPNEFLPAELKNENPLGISRIVDGELTAKAI